MASENGKDEMGVAAALEGIEKPKRGKRVLSGARKHEKEARREQVARMRVLGMPAPQIAERLGVPESSVRKDLEAIRKHNAISMAPLAAEQAAGEFRAGYDYVIDMAREEAERADEGSRQKLAALDLVRQTLREKWDAFRDCGIVPSEPVTVEHRHEIALPHLEELRRAAKERLLASALKRELLPPEADPAAIEVEILPVKS